MKFSQRIGKVPSIKQLQIESLDDDLKNGLWNGLKIYVLDNLSKHDNYGNDTEFDVFCSILWHNYYKLPIDTIPKYVSSSEHFIRDTFYKGQWYETYDLIEFIANIDSNSFSIDTSEFKEFCNGILEREFSGYRFINDKISPITNENEIAEIENAINQSDHFTSLRGANIHLKSALEKLSDKKSPDYRNSIKESISAIESVTKVISENAKDSLGAALDKLKGKIKLHPALERGFKQLYGYTSDSDGIRHALMEDHNCDFEDAKYMLVSSSAFINYLIIKANKSGVKFK
ncbi:hypothetical protein GFJ94_00815 [Flavobacterium sp. LMO8]|uniref:AbiJ-NTD4 domain-containing protein n=1 Tax=Flavobacterium sp. LMO8 TaxID=2654244 RepID=UPI001290A737|nr:hypothetical protein [Flavobacterium sp. LMO8]MQP23603.1 hypothetical protein [Flavobacterium sp. LMO8]